MGGVSLQAKLKKLRARRNLLPYSAEVDKEYMKLYQHHLETKANRERLKERKKFEQVCELYRHIEGSLPLSGQFISPTDVDNIKYELILDENEGTCDNRDEDIKPNIKDIYSKKNTRASRDESGIKFAIEKKSSLLYKSCFVYIRQCEQVKSDSKLLYRCSCCSQVLSGNEINAHQLMHMNDSLQNLQQSAIRCVENVFHCKVCRRKLASFQSIYKHVTLVHKINWQKYNETPADIFETSSLESLANSDSTFLIAKYKTPTSTERKPYRNKCLVCKAEFASSNTLHKHVTEAHNVDLAALLKLPETAFENGQLKELLPGIKLDDDRNNSGKEKQCRICKKFFSGQLLRIHVRTIHKVNFAKLKALPDSVFDSTPIEEILPMVKLSIDDECIDSIDEFRCKLCNVYLTNNHLNLKRHVRMQHRREYKRAKAKEAKTSVSIAEQLFPAVIPCSVCRKKFVNKTTLLRHKRDRHPETFNITCLPSMKPLTYETKAQDCMDPHKSSTDFKCKSCDKTFTLRDTLEKHMCIHIPSKKSEDNENLIQQEKKTEIPTFTLGGCYGNKCLVCKTEFASSNTLHKHVTEAHNVDLVTLLKLPGTAFENGQLKELLPGIKLDDERNNSGKEKQCRICKKFFSGQLLRIHVRTIHKVNYAKLKALPDSVFDSKPMEEILPMVKLSIDDECVDSVDEFRCKLCDIYLTNNYLNLKRHVRFQHAQEYERAKEVEAISSVSLAEQLFPAVIPCSICGEKFVNKTTLLRHKREHHPEKFDFHCSTCMAPYSNETKARHCMDRHMRGRDYKCKICDKTFTLRYTLNKHMREHVRSKKKSKAEDDENLIQQEKQTAKKDLTCKICNQTVASRSILSMHMRIKHTGERPYSCTQCDERFYTKHQCTNHLIYKHQYKKYVCAHVQCDQAFFTRRQLHRHNVKDHDDVLPIKCEQCNNCFLLDSQMLSHVKQKHENASQSKSLVCPHDNCEFNCQTRSQLINHMNSGHVDAFYKCDSNGCKFASNNRGAVRLHQRWFHLGSKFLCDKCGQLWLVNRPDLYLTHRLHCKGDKNNRKFKCAGCDMKYKNRRLANECNFRHEGFRPYKCDLCTAAFHRSINLHRHRQKMHPDAPVISDKSLILADSADPCEIFESNKTTPLSKKKTKMPGTPNRQQQTDKKISAQQKKTLPNKPRVCFVCNKEHHTQRNADACLRRHEYDVIDDEPIDCDLCEETFDRALAYFEHVEMVHGDPYFLFVCSICEDAFLEFDTLMRHYSERHEHSNLSIVERTSNDCGESSSNEQAARSPDEPEKLTSQYEENECPLCDASYNTKRELDACIERHQRLKPFDCQYCGDIFELRTLFETHLQEKHAGEVTADHNPTDL